MDVVSNPYGESGPELRGRVRGGDALEHIEETAAFVRAAACHLKPGGYALRASRRAASRIGSVRSIYYAGTRQSDRRNARSQRWYGEQSRQRFLAGCASSASVGDILPSPVSATYWAAGGGPRRATTVARICGDTSSWTVEKVGP
jgi:hypothetical protein